MACCRAIHDSEHLDDGSIQASSRLTLDWYPCYAAGTLTFVDGKSAHWRMSQAGTGSLSAVEGRQLFLYCPTCKRRPFKQ
jgi:hypothetical protein